MTDTERLDFIEAHRVEIFRNGCGKAVAIIGDFNPIATVSGVGRDLRAAVDDCREKNFTADGSRIRHKLHHS
jgi:hypothetical protein